MEPSDEGTRPTISSCSPVRMVDGEPGPLMAREPGYLEAGRHGTMTVGSTSDLGTMGPMGLGTVVPGSRGVLGPGATGREGPTQQWAPVEPKERMAFGEIAARARGGARGIREEPC